MGASLMPLRQASSGESSSLELTLVDPIACAFQLFTAAASKGYTEAAFNLGRMHLLGSTGSRDFRAAAGLLATASSGVGSSANTIGVGGGGGRRRGA